MTLNTLLQLIGVAFAAAGLLTSDKRPRLGLNFWTLAYLSLNLSMLVK